MEEQELLAAFLSGGSNEAFGELVRRNADLVYSSARRQLGDATLAEDVTQAVFILLARKAHSVRGPLPAWLLKTTHYACKDARKLATRRLIHERRAAEMRAAQTGGEAEWEEYAPMLDQAMARLGGKERSAVALRFLRGKSLKEVGVELGVSEKAAEKRVNRAVARLRKLISLKSAPPAAAVLAADLAAKGTQAAPAGMVSAIVAGAGNAAAGSLASAIALHTAAMLIRTKAIAMAMMLVVLLSAVTLTVVAQVPARKTPSPPQPAHAAPIAALAPAESQVPGDVQLARWEILLDETGAKIVLAAAQPVQSGGVFYQAFIGDGAELRATAAQANSTGHLLSTGNGLHVAADRTANAAIKQDELALAQYEPFYFDYVDGNRPHIATWGQTKHSEQTFTRLNNSALHLILDHTGITVQLRDESNVTRATHTASIVYTGDLTAGQAIVWMGRFFWQGKAYYHLCVFETFKAQSDDMFTIRNEGNVLWWVNNGPNKLRRWSVAARAWAAQGDPAEMNGPLTGPWAISRTRADGERVWLTAVGRPATWPSCWWDAVGNPSPILGYVSFAGDPPGGLWAIVKLEGTSRDWAMLNANPLAAAPKEVTDQKVTFQDVLQLSDGAAEFDVGTTVGGWEEMARLAIGEKKQVDGIDCGAKGIPGIPEIILTLHGRLDDEYNLVGVGRDGKEHVDISFSDRWTKVGRSVEPWTWEHYFNLDDLKADELSYVKLMRRKREFVKFDRFALQPVAPPKADVTAAVADEAEVKQRMLTAAEQLQILQTQRSALELLGTDAKTAMGAVRQIAAAIGAGDAAALHKRIKPDALSTEAGEQFIQSLLAASSCRKQLIALYGETKVQAELPQLPDFAMMLMNLNWKKADDGSLSFGGDENDRQLISKEADGEFYLHLHLVSDAMRQSTLKSLETYQKLDAMLKATPPPTLEQAKTALAAAPGL